MGFAKSSTATALHPNRLLYPLVSRYIFVKSAQGSKKTAVYPDSVKKEVYERMRDRAMQGYCDGPQGCEVDHLISLELGGADTVDNLWPQPYDGEWNAWDKDRLEARMHKLICTDRTLKLKDAQEEIRTDWKAIYKKYVGALKPHKPVDHCR